MGTQTQPIIPPAWTVPDWYIDPANLSGVASDSNSGTAATGAAGSGVGPLLTVQEMVVHRWGTTEPVLGQDTAIHLLSPETLGQESVALKPIMVGGHNFVVIGTLAVQGAAFAAGAVTAKVRASPGTLLQVAGFTHGETAGMLVHNVDNDSYAFIDSVTGPGVATMTQPIAAAGLNTVTVAPTYTEDDGWDAGDSLQVYVLPLLNLKVFQPQGGDSNAGYTATVGWLQNVHVSDASGVPGNSTFNPTALNGSQIMLSNCWIAPILCVSSEEAAFTSFAANCWAPGGAVIRSCAVIGGALNTNLTFASVVENVSALDGDVIVHGTVSVKGPYTIFGYVYVDTTVAVAHGGVVMLEPDFFAATHLWGPCNVNLEGPASCMQNASGGSWATCLTVSTLEIEGAATASSFNAAAAGNPFVAGVNITSANLDTGGGAGNPGLQNPRTGSRFSST